MSPFDLLKAILPSLVVMAVGLVAVWWLRRGLSAWRQRSGWEGAALALSYLVGHLAQMGWLGFPPNNAAGWMPFLAAAGVIVSITAAPGLGPAWWSTRLVTPQAAASAQPARALASSIGKSIARSRRHQRCLSCWAKSFEGAMSTMSPLARAE